MWELREGRRADGSRHTAPQPLPGMPVFNAPRRDSGDRSSDCGALMEPIAVWVRSGGEWAIIHRCTECGSLSSNRIAADDSGLVLLSLAVRPLSAPPFPLDRWAEM